MTEPNRAPPAAPPVALVARRSRIHALRRRIAIFSVRTFLAAWGVVFGQLVSGRDPALARDAAPVTAQSADPGDR